MSRKTTKHTATDKKVAKYELFDEYYDIFTLRKTPISLAAIEQLACKLLKWAHTDPTAYKLSQFWKNEGINSTTLKRWSDRSPMLQEAIQAAREIIGDRREIGALKRQLSEGIVASSMSIYDPEWKAMAEWRASLKQEKDSQSNPVTVVIENYPEEKK